MNKIFASTMAALLLSACATLKPMTDQQKIETVCQSAASTLEVLNTARERGAISDNENLQIIGAISILRPVCSAPTAPSLNQAERDAIEAAAKLLVSKASEVN